jgi:hypothetical protein
MALATKTRFGECFHSSPSKALKILEQPLNIPSGAVHTVHWNVALYNAEASKHEHAAVVGDGHGNTQIEPDDAAEIVIKLGR